MELASSAPSLPTTGEAWRDARPPDGLQLRRGHLSTARLTQRWARAVTAADSRARPWRRPGADCGAGVLLAGLGRLLRPTLGPVTVCTVWPWRGHHWKAGLWSAAKSDY